MPRIVLTVSNPELSGLLKLAHSELRSPKDQLRFILRKELIQLELFQKTNTTKDILVSTSMESGQENQ